MKRTLVIGLGLALAACGGEQHQDLKEELKKLTTDLRGKVEPLPVVKPYEPVPYQAFDLPDPFGAAKIELAPKTASGGGGLKPGPKPPPEALDAVPRH